MTQPNPRDRSMESTVWSKPVTLIDDFAECLSEHGNVSRAADQCGVSASFGRVLLHRIKKRLGPQAR